VRVLTAASLVSQLLLAPSTAPADSGARWAWVSAYVTVPSARTARRIKVVTHLFPLCDGDELPSEVFAATDSAVRAAARRTARAPFIITHRRVAVRASRDSAAAARERELDDGRFARTVQVAAAGATCCCARSPRWRGALGASLSLRIR
jgi:hypothetical protein